MKAYLSGPQQVRGGVKRDQPVLEDQMGRVIEVLRSSVEAIAKRMCESMTYVLGHFGMSDSRDERKETRGIDFDTQILVDQLNKLSAELETAALRMRDVLEGISERFRAGMDKAARTAASCADRFVNAASASALAARLPAPRQHTDEGQAGLSDLSINVRDVIDGFVRTATEVSARLGQVQGSGGRMRWPCLPEPLSAATMTSAVEERGIGFSQWPNLLDRVVAERDRQQQALVVMREDRAGKTKVAQPREKSYLEEAQVRNKNADKVEVRVKVSIDADKNGVISAVVRDVNIMKQAAMSDTY